MNQHFFEKQFTIFALIFFTGALACDSLFVTPERLTAPFGVGGGAENPLLPLLSLTQYGLYAVAFILILLRLKSSIQAALRDKLVWLLAGMTLVSTLWSDAPDVSLQKGVVTLQTTSFGLYMASRYSLKEQLQMLTWAMGLVAVFSLLFCVAFPGAALETGANAGSWRGPFVQKNQLAKSMALGALAFLLVALDTRKHRYLLWIGFGLCTGLVLISGSQTGLLILLILMVLLPLYGALRWSDTVMIPFFITAALITSSIAVVVASNWQNLLLGLGRDSSLSGRTELWEIVIKMIEQRPWLGYGYLGFWPVATHAIDIFRALKYQPPHAHNGFLNIALDLGLVGLLFFVLSILITFKRAVTWVRITKTSADLWPLLYVTLLFMYNYSESTTVGHNSIFWVLYVAIALSLKRFKLVKHKLGNQTQQKV